MIALLLSSVSASAVLSGASILVDTSRIVKFSMIKFAGMHASRLVKFSLMQFSDEMQVARIAKFILIEPV